MLQVFIAIALVVAAVLADTPQRRQVLVDPMMGVPMAATSPAFIDTVLMDELPPLIEFNEPVVVHTVPPTIIEGPFPIMVRGDPNNFSPLSSLSPHALAMLRRSGKGRHQGNKHHQPSKHGRHGKPAGRH